MTILARGTFVLLFLAALATAQGAQCSTTWQGGPGFGFVSQPWQASVHCLKALPGGQRIAGGFFEIAGTVPCNSVARWDGAAWQAMGAGVWDAAHSRMGVVSAVTTLANGDVVVGGEFTHAGAVAVDNLARWDGANWHPIGIGIDGPVNALAILDNGDLVVGGYFAHAGGVASSNIARWDGVQWHPIGPIGFGLDGEVTSLLRQSNGGLVAGGHFHFAGGVYSPFVARWDGASWSALGEGLDYSSSIYPGVYALAELPNGDLAVGGEDFYPRVGGVEWGLARWDGAAWHSLGHVAHGPVFALSALPNGDLVAGGFRPAGGQGDLARWNGHAWVDLALVPPGGGSFALEGLVDGTLCVGGGFTSVGALSANGFARLTTTCPAAAVTVPTACVGPAGPVTLTADALPWTGSTFRATATGFAANALAVGMIGIGSPGSPLSQLHPTGIPGCSLLTNPMDWTLLVPTAGAASWLFSIPNDPIYAGVLLHHQMLQLEVDSAPSLLSLSSSNGLALTMGSF